MPYFDIKKTVVITGAGISVESGIQPFRGKNGLWNENPTEMATYAKFLSEPALFLEWYYRRYLSCKNALPNKAHQILASTGLKVITQNIDNLHRRANHSYKDIIEIHGNIFYKRKVESQSIKDLILSDWDTINENNLTQELFRLFNIKGEVTASSYRPHVLLFDERYNDLYETEIAIEWMYTAETIIFMGTSNSVGITSIALQMGIDRNKNIIVVDPSPADSFKQDKVEIIYSTATDFCREFLL